MLVNLSRDDSVPTASMLADLMAHRRTVRKLRHGRLTTDAINRIFEAARRTPAAYNHPSWRVVTVHERREPFWELVDAAFRTELEGERRERYLTRLADVRGGVGAVLIFEDRDAVEAMRSAQGISLASAQAYSEQGLGMVQLALWLAIVAEGLATSLQHWEAFIQDAVCNFLDLSPGRYRLVTTMPLGYAADSPDPVRPTDLHQVISLDAHVEGGCIKPT